MEKIKSKALLKSAATLPDLIKAAYADSTLHKYRNAWHQWISWSEKFPEVLYCPADPFFVALYFNDLLLTKGTLGAISDANSGIRWGHINAGVYSPTNHPFVKLVFEGAKRLASKSSVSRQKEPITTEMIKQCVAKHKTSENLMHLRFMIISMIGFAGFLRIGEMLEIKIKHISIFDDRVEILIPKSKTDQLKKDISFI